MNMHSNRLKIFQLTTKDTELYSSKFIRNVLNLMIFREPFQNIMSLSYWMLLRNSVYIDIIEIIKIRKLFS